jgi:hypothetical protein
MNSIEELECRKNELITQIQRLETMRRGTISEQYLKVPRKNMEPSLRGPYYVFAKNLRGKTISSRINNFEELELLRKDVENYKRFNDLSKEFVSVMEAITDIKRSGSITDFKKNGKSTKKNTTAK